MFGAARVKSLFSIWYEAQKFEEQRFGVDLIERAQTTIAFHSLSALFYFLLNFVDIFNVV